MIESLPDSGDTGAHRSSFFEAHSVRYLRQMTVFDHGVLGISTIFELLLRVIDEPRSRRLDGVTEMPYVISTVTDRKYFVAFLYIGAAFIPYFFDNA